MMCVKSSQKWALISRRKRFSLAKSIRALFFEQ